MLTEGKLYVQRQSAPKFQGQEAILGTFWPLCPVVGQSEEPAGHCVRQNAGLDGQLVWASRVLFMFLPSYDTDY